MNNQRFESYCPRCGLVVNDYFKYDELREGMSPFNSPWRANFPQTRNPFVTIHGRVIMQSESQENIIKPL